MGWSFRKSKKIGGMRVALAGAIIGVVAYVLAR
jgi:hypothetical protein